MIFFIYIYTYEQNQLETTRHYHHHIPYSRFYFLVYNESRISISNHCYSEKKNINENNSSPFVLHFSHFYYLLFHYSSKTFIDRCFFLGIGGLSCFRNNQYVFVRSMEMDHGNNGFSMGRYSIYNHYLLGIQNRC